MAFNLVVTFQQQHCQYTPRSDYSTWIGVFPCLLVEVNSKNTWDGQKLAEDHSCLLLQGASTIWLINFVGKHKGEQKPAILMVVYIDKECKARRHLLFQAEGSPVSSTVRIPHLGQVSSSWLSYTALPGLLHWRYWFSTDPWWVVEICLCSIQPSWYSKNGGKW